MITFLRHGNRADGDASSASGYVLAEHDHRGRERELVRVLRGDPNRVARVADSLTTQHRYTSGVIAWSVEDAPTEDQIAEVLADFERFAWAGLDPDRACWSAVRHDEADGSVHVHVLAARVDLETGRALNIAPPSWRKDFGPWRDRWNISEGWARPEDPQRARQSSAKDERRPTRAAQKKAIEAHVWGRVATHDVRDRADVVRVLGELGEVTRQGRNYLSVRVPLFDKPFRLKGTFFDGHFSASAEDWGAAAARAADAADPKRGRVGETMRTLKEAKEDLAEAFTRRAAYNAKRFKPKAPASVPAPSRTPAEVTPTPVPALELSLPTPTPRGSTHARHRRDRRHSGAEADARRRSAARRRDSERASLARGLGSALQALWSLRRRRSRRPRLAQVWLDVIRRRAAGRAGGYRGRDGRRAWARLRGDREMARRRRPELAPGGGGPTQ